jgi:hypothetical protein
LWPARKRDFMIVTQKWKLIFQIVGEKTKIEETQVIHSTKMRDNEKMLK